MTALDLLALLVLLLGIWSQPDPVPGVTIWEDCKSEMQACYMLIGVGMLILFVNHLHIY